MLRWFPRRRSRLAVAAAVLVLLSLVPPAGAYARRYVFAESLQFAVFATVVPALLVLGAPWRLLLPRRFFRSLGAGPAGRDEPPGHAAVRASRAAPRCCWSSWAR